MAEIQNTENTNIGKNVEKKEFSFHCYGKWKIIVTVEKQGEKCQSGKVILHVIPSVWYSGKPKLRKI